MCCKTNDPRAARRVRFFLQPQERQPKGRSRKVVSRDSGPPPPPGTTLIYHIKSDRTKAQAATLLAKSIRGKGSQSKPTKHVRATYHNRLGNEALRSI